MFGTLLFLAAVAAGPRPQVVGTVTTAGGPLPGCTVRFTASGFVWTVVSDAEGRYAFREVPVGEGELSYDLAGFGPKRIPITVHEGDNRVLPADLQAELNEPITFTCGAPCGQQRPTTPWDRPSCDDYDFDSSLIAAAAQSDGSAIVLLRQRYDTADSTQERQRIGAALLRRIGNDEQILNALASDAENAVRFAHDGYENHPDLAAWCGARGYDPDDYWRMAWNALDQASADPRFRPLLIKALATKDDVLVFTAIHGLAVQHDESALPRIDETLARFPEDASAMAFGLADFASDAADRIADKYLRGDDREQYATLRGPSSLVTNCGQSQCSAPVAAHP